MKFLFSLALLFLNLFSSEYDIALLMWSNSVEGQVLMKDGIIEETQTINKDGKKINLNIFEAGDGEIGMEKQKRQIKRLLDEKKVDLFIIQPTDSAVLKEAIDEIIKSKIPIVTYDGYILDAKSTTHLTSDNYSLGYLNGEYIAHSFDRNKTIDMVIVTYPHVPQTIERVEGFFEALNDFGVKYNILKEYKAVNPEMGTMVAFNILKEFPEKNSIDVIFAINDAGAYPIVKALDKAGRDEIFFASIDGDPRMVEYIKKDRIVKIDSAQFCKILGKETIKISYNILSKKDAPKSIIIPAFPVTKETISRFNGWDGEIPSSFEKPWRAKKNIWNNSLIISK